MSTDKFDDPLVLVGPLIQKNTLLRADVISASERLSLTLSQADPITVMPIFNEELYQQSIQYENNPELLNDNIRQLREWLTRKANIPDISDEMLMQFHHSCFYTIDNIKSCIKTYYSTRNRVPEAFKDRDLTRPELAQAQKKLCVAVFPEVDSGGCCIVYSGLKESDRTDFNYLYVSRLFFMALDSAIHQRGKMAGLVLVFDMKGVTLKHLLKCHPWLIRKFTIYTQLYIHKAGTATYHNHFQPEVLPMDLGGSLPITSELCAETAEYMTWLLDFFVEDERNRIKGMKIKQDNKPNTSENQIPLETLEID